MKLNCGRGVGLGLVLGAMASSTAARADTARFADPAASTTAPAGTVSPAPTHSSAPATSAAESGAHAPPASAPLASPPDPEQAAWDSNYAHARAAFAEGKFRRAADAFSALIQTAPTPEQHALCTELATIADHWAGAGLRLTLPHSPEASATGNTQPNTRTTDEISVLYLNSVAYGLGTGVWLATLTKPQNVAGAILPALALAGGAAGVVAWFDHSSRLAYGVPASAVSGMYIGLEEGITWSLWNQAKSPYYGEWQASTLATVIWSSATAGAIAGAVIGDTAGATPGRASYVGSGALWGGLLGGLVVAAASGDDRGQRDDHALLAAAISTNIGVVGGLLSASAVSPSVARVRFIDLGGLAGGLVAGGLYLSAANKVSENNAQGLFGVTALGVAGGLALSTFLTKNMPADHGATTDEAPSALNIEPTLVPVRGGTLIGALGTF